MSATPKKNDKSKLVAHAINELTIAGMYGPTAPPEQKVLSDNIVDLVEVFAEQHHSGSTAGLVIEALYQLLKFEPLTDLTDDPDEWVSVSEEFGEPMWQSKRGGAFFSKDGGKTWTHVGTDKTGKSKHKGKIDVD